MVKDGELCIKCDCHCHELHIERWDENVTDTTQRLWLASIWSRGYETKPNWMSRLGHIWHIILHGRPYGDEIVISRTEMEKLFNYTNKELNNT